MKKYRILTLEELDLLKKDFIEFLVINGITGEDWEEIKLINPENRDKVVELFSEVVFTKILLQTNFLELKTDKVASAIQCNKENMVMITLESVKEHSEIYSTDKTYQKSREEEIYALMQKGFLRSDGKLYKELWMLKIGS
jgi:hypothetical protein|tara:strand:- start:846 stop:1265 length:420 start_codon:yes stop_codon:yes gene_type:complete